MNIEEVRALFRDELSLLRKDILKNTKRYCSRKPPRQTPTPPRPKTPSPPQSPMQNFQILKRLLIEKFKSIYSESLDPIIQNKQKRQIQLTFHPDKVDKASPELKKLLKYAINRDSLLHYTGNVFSALQRHYTTNTSISVSRFKKIVENEDLK